MPDPAALTAFQIDVAKLFFSLPAAAGFVLAGGAALVANALTDRPTQDLDFFTQRGAGDVATACAELEQAAQRRGWHVTYVRRHATFCRLVITGEEDLLVDVCVDAPATRPAQASILGPTLAPEELAGRKLLALFDRAEARDFADSWRLVQRFGKDLLLHEAQEVDAGLDVAVLADMMRRLSRFDDHDIPVPADEVAALRAFFRDWADQLDAT